MKHVKYRGLLLMKGSTALELYKVWEANKTPEAKKKLDKHLDQIEATYKKLTYDNVPN